MGVVFTMQKVVNRSTSVMFARASTALRERIPVILDGAFLYAKLRQQAASLAGRYGARFLIVNCRCPRELEQERLAARDARGNSISDARPGLLDEQRADEEPVSADFPQCELDTTLAHRTIAAAGFGSPARTGWVGRP